MLAGRLVIALYGFSVGDPVQLWATALPAAASAFILSASLRSAPGTERVATVKWALTVASIATLSLLAPGSIIESVALVSMAVLSSVPHLVAALRSVDPAGVRVAAWLASAFSSVLWVLHGVLGGFAAVVVANTIWLGVSGSVAAVVLHTRRRPASP
jgi:uncharacterized protein with PQ loop repeat